MSLFQLLGYVVPHDGMESRWSRRVWYYRYLGPTAFGTGTARKRTVKCGQIIRPLDFGFSTKGYFAAIHF